ncbi:aspartate kinase [candidate division NPL-UPA2 bacterium]|nr:aspartate kinase [candidate division NPL-UPA2 bacterium]
MALIVQKYGGSSVANPERIKRVAKRIVAAKCRGEKIVVVVSAPGDSTDRLIDMAHRIASEPAEREMDVLVSTGEQVSVALLAIAIQSLGCPAISSTGPQVGIVTDSSHTKARILKIDTNRIKEELRKGKIVIVAGFQGTDINENITTLGRGGSDLTAVALAAALQANCCEIYTDVEGVYTADPHIVSRARKLVSISYDEMLEMASAGAKVLHNRAVEFAKRFNIPIQVRSSFSKGEGTMVTKEQKFMEDVVVRGVTLNTDEAKVSLRGVPDKPGVAAKVFKTVADKGINIDMIIQNIGEEGKSDISFTVIKGDLKKTLAVTRKVAKIIKAKRVDADENIARISIVGVGMRTHSGIAAQMFGALASKKINIEMISTSEIKISCIVDKEQGSQAVRAIHAKFKLGKR